MNNVVVIAPHPDDETLGCGGAILKHISKGDNVYWVIVTCANEEIGFTKESIENRKMEIEIVSKMYGFKKVYNLDFPTTQLEKVDKRTLVEKISNCILETEANILYIPNWGDVHSDHKVVSEAAISCTKWFRYPNIKTVYSYETLSETEFGINNSINKFNGNVFVNIDDFLDKKIEIMKVFKSEMGVFPFPRSEEAIRALAMLRGSNIGCNYAESFMLLRQIID